MIKNKEKMNKSIKYTMIGMLVAVSYLNIIPAYADLVLTKTRSSQSVDSSQNLNPNTTNDSLVLSKTRSPQQILQSQTAQTNPEQILNARNPQIQVHLRKNNQKNLQISKNGRGQMYEVNIPDHPVNDLPSNLTSVEQKYYQNLDTLVQGLILKDNPQEYRNSTYAQSSTGFLRPVNYRINSKFGMRKHPILGTMKMHTGVDFAAPKGTPIRAAKDGLVIFADTKGGYGETIIIKHDQKYMTLYGHASKLIAHVGQEVRQGDVIALVGDTGRSTGPHLHFEVFENGQRINPERHL